MKHVSKLLLTIPLVLSAAGCSSVTAKLFPEPVAEVGPSLFEPQLAKVLVVTKPENPMEIKQGSRIVITNIEGPCAEPVSDALMRRLINNPKFDILTRANLDQIIFESEQAWFGKFNTKTANRLGELLGASMFIVGRISYCKPSTRGAKDLHIVANLQVFDLTTGRVLRSSSSGGAYLPGNIPAHIITSRELAEAIGNDPERHDTKAQFWRSLGESTINTIRNVPVRLGAKGAPGNELNAEPINDGDQKATDESDEPSRPGVFSPGADSSKRKDARKNRKKKENNEKAIDLPVILAADDLANQFADQFFARSNFEWIYLWDDPRWSYSRGIEFVRLGRCEKAAELLDEVFDEEVDRMREIDLARYLHNFGTALICANQPERAVNKLIQAYRLNDSAATLNMLAMARRALEWDLTVETSEGTEIDSLIERYGEVGVSGEQSVVESEAGEPSGRASPRL